MTKTIKLAVVAALALGATSAFATNGDNLIATGAKARAMGGVGIATSFGAESSVANPALLSSVKSSEFSGSVTAFMPDVNFVSDAFNQPGFTAAEANSDADLSYIPEFAYAKRVNNNLVYGVSVTGTAGMGTDYDDTSGSNGANRMQTQLQLMKIAVPVSYQMGALSLGVAPVLHYGSLSLSHLYQDNLGATQFMNNGKSSDLTLGYEVGAAYNVTSDLTIGAVYKSKLHMQYANTISTSVAVFAADATAGMPNPVTSGDNLDQPAEYGVGVSYVMGGSTLAVDYKRIEWGSANGYKDFGWEDQDAYSIGYEYANKSWAFRAGYNYAKSPIKEQAGNAHVAEYNGAVRNFFSLAGFPGMVESHYTIGGGYNISDALSLDMAVVYAAEETNSFDTSALSRMGMAMGMGGTPAAHAAAGAAPIDTSADVKHSQLGITIGATYRF